MFEWDSAVAYYSGSLWDSPTYGNILMYYANKRCEDMRTCGKSGTEKQGTSLVNKEIFDLFLVGQHHLMDRFCEGAETAKNRIIELMTVPLIQGAIRYAHIVEGKIEKRMNNVERYNGGAAGYALAVLPLVHHCNPADAQIIYNNMKPQSRSSLDFVVVKSALERNYKCMNVRCHEVGGIYDFSTNSYKPGAEACNDLTVGLTDQQRNWLVALGVSLGGMLIFGIIVCVVRRTENEIAEPPRSDLQLHANTDAELT